MSRSFIFEDRAFSNLSDQSYNGNLPAAEEPLRCPQSRIRDRKRRVYFRFFESMGFHEISMQRKSFCGQHVEHTTVVKSTMAIFPAINNRSDVGQIPGCLFVIGSCRSPIVPRTNQNAVKLVCLRNSAICTFRNHFWQIDVNNLSFLNAYSKFPYPSIYFFFIFFH